MRQLKWVLPFFLLVLSTGLQAQGTNGPDARIAMAEAVVDIARLAEFAVTRDGRSIAYIVAAPTPEGEAYALTLWAGEAGNLRSARRLADLPASPSIYVETSLSFAPDGTQLAYRSRGQVHLVDLATGRDRALTLAGLPEGATVAELAWAPNGTELAVILSFPTPPEPAGGREMSVAWPYWGGDSGPGRRVAIVQVESGRASLVTGADLDVAELNWSPDGRRLALAASPTSSGSRYYDQDIYLVDRAGAAAAQPIVRLEGVDSSPVWSPDGARIAFATQHGQGSRDWLQGLGLYDVRTGQVSYPARAQIENGFGSPRSIAWGSNTRLLFQSDHHFRAPIVALDVARERMDRLSPLDLSFYSGLAVPSSGGTIFFTCESIDRPRDLCASPADRFQPRRLTSLNPNLQLPPSEAEIVTWRSADDRWDLEGVVVRPRGSRSPRPLITLIEGGPTMARVHFGLVQWYPVHALLASGYAVFVPNTRGRSGYSRAFRRSIPENRDFAPGPYSDMMTGIDKLVRDGIADPERLGLAGHSYGGFLTAYSITQTRRFGAASVSDAPVNFPYAMSLGAANPAMQEHWRHQSGFSDPYDPADLALMRAQSPITRIAEARTPTLLEFGYREFGGVGEMSGGEFLHGLRRFNVPAELILYPQTGHGIHQPRLIRESARRNLEWFDHWLLGRSTSRMRERYPANNPG